MKKFIERYLKEEISRKCKVIEYISCNEEMLYLVTVKYFSGICHMRNMEAIIIGLQREKLFKVQRVKSLKYHWKVSGHLSIVAKECEQEDSMECSKTPLTFKFDLDSGFFH